MANKMIIDASHPEETRVVVLRGNRVEEFDFESASKRPLRGNIYLAKVTRVEPSLQAAFVDYGGNRHGFLAFSEIHPDYYQIPVADRQALLEEEALSQREEDEEPSGERRSRRHRRPRRQEVEARVETRRDDFGTCNCGRTRLGRTAPPAVERPRMGLDRGARSATTAAVSGDTDAASTGATWTGEAAERPGAESEPESRQSSEPDERRPQGPPSKRDRTIRASVRVRTPPDRAIEVPHGRDASTRTTTTR